MRSGALLAILLLGSVVAADEAAVQHAEFPLDLRSDRAATINLLVTDRGLQVGALGQSGVLVTEPQEVPLTDVAPFLAASAVWTVEHAAEDAVAVEVRSSPDGNDWSDWEPVRRDADAEGGTQETFGGLVFLPKETALLQFRVTLPYEDALPATLTAFRAVFISPGESLDPSPELAADAIETLAVSKPPVVSRTGWGCPDGQNSPQWTWQYTTVTHLIVHHTDNSNSSSDWAAVVRSIHTLHKVTRGWGDIGYNYLVDPNGVVYEGRAGGDNVIGAHFSCANGGTMGVAFIGTFTSVPPTSAAWTSAVRILAWKADQRGIDPHGTAFHSGTQLTLNRISGHRDANPSPNPNACPTGTVCPGSTLYSSFPTLRNDVENLIDPPPAPSNDSCSNATTLTSGTSCNYTAGTVLNATASGVVRPGCDNTSANPADVWYRFTAAAASHTISVDPDGSSGDQVVAVYGSCSGSELACRDSGGVGGVETLTVNGLNVGSTYYVRVYDFGNEEPTGSNATFRICVTHTAVTNYTISVSASPSAGGTVSGGGTYGAGSSRTVTASANSNYAFNNWTENGNVVSSNTSYTFTLNGNRSLVANFSPVSTTYTISLSASPSAGGTVSGGGTYAAGSSRTVSASANSSYTFSNWTENGNVVSSSTNYTFTLNSNRTLVANFSGSSGGGSPHPFIEVTGATVQAHDLGVGGDGSVYVLFAKSNPKELFVVKSTNGGESWQQPVAVPGSDHDNSEFRMAVDSAGVIHVVWCEGSADQAFYSRSTNGGASFSNPIAARSGNSHSGYSTRNATDPVVGADGSGNVYVGFGAYTMNSSGTFLGYNVWVAKSTNGGNSFQAEIPINAISSAQKKPRRIRATASNFYVLYLDETNDDLYFHRSTAGALANNPRVNSHANEVDFSGDFVVGSGETSFYAVYADTFNDSSGDITFCKSTDGGNDWSTCRTVNDNTSRNQESPAIGIDSAGRLHVAWSDFRGDETQTFYSYSTDGGSMFATNVNVSEPFTDARFTQPHVAIDNGSASVYFSATREISQVMVARRSTNVQPPTDLTAPTGSLSVNSGATHTNSTSVTLTLSATDAVGVTGYYTSNSSANPSAGQAGWVSVPSTTSFSGMVNNWQIESENEGSESVYVWFKDAAGNISARRSDGIVLDQTPPTNPSLTATGGPGNVQLAWSGETDALSGVASTKLVFAVGTNAPANCSGSTLATGSPYTHNGLTAGQPYSYRVCAIDSAGNTSAGTTATATPQQGGGSVDRVRNDVNGDRRADIFWRNTSTGWTSVWFMNGTAYSSAALGPQAAAGWTPAVAGDFDGDGRTDFFWRNASTGQTSVWLGWNGGAFSMIAAGPTIPVEWAPVLAGDIDGDDKDDIFWRNGTTGETSIWFMNGATYSLAVRATTVPAPWYPAVSGDFDGNERADLFWRNLSTGETSLWMNWNGSSFAQVASATAPTVWVPVGAGDVTGDRRSDVVWRNSSTGQTSLWVMNGAATPAFVVLTTVPTNWGSVAFGDYDGDTRTDIFWRNAGTGETSVWTGYDGAAFTTQVRGPTVPVEWLPFHSR